ncbi:carboxypeptidase-like regulatory domain-containing protein [Streptomyces sp. NPDC127106]|uniref:carboxypeptidase-like regulatory domain-containing protein n=1 Tax=Streptomyces sp. NPDC127106 TaxID=3345360 RepID=UPI0036380471
MTPTGGARTHLIGGVVVDTDGSPAPGVSVYLAGGPGPFPDVAALTGTDGRFSFSVSAQGVYTVQCRAPDGRSAQASAAVGSGGAASVVLRLA